MGANKERSLSLPGIETVSERAGTQSLGTPGRPSPWELVETQRGHHTSCREGLGFQLILCNHRGHMTSANIRITKNLLYISIFFVY